MTKAKRPNELAFRDRYLAVFVLSVILLISGEAKAQLFQFPNPGTFGIGQHRGAYDSTLYFPTGCGVPSGVPALRSYGFAGLGQVLKQSAFYYDSCGHKLWIYDPSSSTWAGFSAGVLDTTSLSNRINQRVTYADTTGELLPYARKNQVVANLGGAPSFQEDVAANRPAAGNAGAMYLATDTKLLYRDNGSSWDLIASGGSGGGVSTASGDAAGTASGTNLPLTIQPNVVDNTKLATMPANTIKGSIAGGTPQDLTPAQVAAMLPADTTFGKRGINVIQVAGKWVVVWGASTAIDSAIYVNGGNAQKIEIDSMHAATGHGFRVNYGSDAGYDMFVRDSATGFWTRIPKGTPGQSLQMLSTGGIGWAAQAVGGGGNTNSNIGSGFRLAVPSTNNIKTLFCVGCTIDSISNTNALTITTTGGTGVVDSVMRKAISKNVPSSDTGWKRIFCIPDIDVSGGTGNGATMPWFILTTGGNHGQAPDMDSDLYVGSDGHLRVYHETALAVANANFQDDEVTYPINWGVIYNADYVEGIANISKSGIGFIVKGQNTNAWSVLNSQLYTYSISGNTGSGPDSVAATGNTMLKFDLPDGANANLGPTITGLVARYVGGNGYSLERVAVSPHQYNYQLKDVFGGIVTGYPQPSDSIEVTDTRSHWEALDLRQFLTGTNWLFAAGLSNLWFSADFKVFPDSNRIGRPVLTAVASGTAGQINLSWSRVTNDVNGYELQRSTVANFSGGVVTLVNPITLGGTLVTSFNDTGLTTGTTYYYRLRASRISGQYSAHARRKSAVAP